MLYDLSMSESNKYESLKNNFVSTVYVIQEIAGTRAGNPKINIMGASNYCLLYTSPSPRDGLLSRMPSSA